MNHKKYIKYSIIAISIIALLSLLAAFAVAYKLSERLTYKKIDQIAAERSRLIAGGAQPVTFTTQDNYTIAALLVKRAHAKRIFVIVHGFKHTKERMADYVQLFPQDTLLLIDLRGQGQSSGNRLSMGLNEHLDIVAAVDYVKNAVSSKLPVFGIGVSQGGASVLRAAAAGARFDAVIADSAPSEFKDTVVCVLQETRRIPFAIGYMALWFYQLIMGVRMCHSNYQAYAHAITCPVLIMHDLKDHLIDYSHAENIHTTLTCSPKQLQPITGTRHGRMHKQIPDVYVQTIETFICGIK